MKEVEKEHSGKNMARYLLEVIKDYEIKKNLGYIVIDNALDNNTLMTSLSYSLCCDFKLHYDPIHHCICCQGHVINLTVKLFLFVMDKESIKEDKAISVFKVTIKEIKE